MKLKTGSKSFWDNLLFFLEALLFFLLVFFPKIFSEAIEATEDFRLLLLFFSVVFSVDFSVDFFLFFAGISSSSSSSLSCSRDSICFLNLVMSFLSGLFSLRKNLIIFLKQNSSLFFPMIFS